MHYKGRVEGSGRWRGRQTVHSSVKLYCKIRRSAVPDTLRGTQSSFADVFEIQIFFLSSEDLFTRVHWLPKWLPDRRWRRRRRGAYILYGIRAIEFSARAKVMRIQHCAESRKTHYSFGIYIPDHRRRLLLVGSIRMGS